jgi:hypothetical protein
MCFLKYNKKARIPSDKKCDKCDGRWINCKKYIPLIPKSDVIIGSKK